ncbi:MAG: hypothetical protein NWS22_12320, partial [Porticoccaceae bacterium]|nr:hypothetical protein [Porticoccaceae bacterium]
TYWSLTVLRWTATRPDVREDKENKPHFLKNGQAVIQAMPDIPKTRSGKIAEIPVRKAIHGEPIGNTEALANPETLALFYRCLDTHSG